MRFMVLVDRCRFLSRTIGGMALAAWFALAPLGGVGADDRDEADTAAEAGERNASQPPTWRLPRHGALVGEIETTRARADDTLVALARREGLGYTEVLAANPDVDRWVPDEDATIVLPRQRILPDAPYEGIVVNLAEMRLYHYQDHENGATVTIYPVGIGREGWSTPTGSYRVTERREDPVWTVPKSILEEYRERGEEHPAVVEPGPDNPLGSRSLRLDNPSYLIHGTNRHYGVGMRVSHGCIRMYNEHIEAVYPETDVETPVTIVNQPFKATIQGGVLYFEAHAPIPEDEDESPPSAMELFAEPILAATRGRPVSIDWEKAVRVAQEQKGLPTPIGRTQAKHAKRPAQWVLQVGSFSSRDNAEDLSWRLSQSGFSASVELPRSHEEGSQHRVVLGPFDRQEDALKHRARLEQAGLQSYVFIRGGELPRIEP